MGTLPREEQSIPAARGDKARRAAVAPASTWKLFSPLPLIKKNFFIFKNRYRSISLALEKGESLPAPEQSEGG